MASLVFVTVREQTSGTWIGFGHILWLEDPCLTDMGTRELTWLSLRIPLGYPLESPNTGLNGIILAMSIGNTLVYLIDYIWHINWCVTCIGTWKILWHFNWVPSLLLSCLGIWNTDWKADGNFTWKLSGQVTWGISRIVFILLFVSPLQALFESYSWYNVL